MGVKPQTRNSRPVWWCPGRPMLRYATPQPVTTSSTLIPRTNPDTSPQSRIKSPVSDPRFVMAIVGICRHMVHIRASEKDDLIPLCPMLRYATPQPVTTRSTRWTSREHPNVVLGAILSFFEPFCVHLSPKVAKVSYELTFEYPHEGPGVDPVHTEDFEGFVASRFGWSRDQIYTA